jgi:hypothetical protein
MDPAPLLTRRLLLITGKGGIGKTLVAAAIGQEAAARGKRVLMVESAACAQLAPLFGVSGEGHETVAIRPGFSTLNIDPPDNFREYVVKYLGQKVLYDKVFGHKVVQSFINTIPGLAELMLLGRLFYHVELAPATRPDLVIFDGFASGHFLSLMTTPDAVLSSNLGGPVAREAARVKEFLGDAARCGIVYVAVPEELVVSEALDFLPQLAARSPAKVLGAAVNRVPAAPGGGAGAAAVYAGRRWHDAQAALTMLREGMAARVDGTVVWTLPELGFIDEPLPADFGATFLGAAERG